MGTAVRSKSFQVVRHPLPTRCCPLRGAFLSPAGQPGRNDCKADATWSCRVRRCLSCRRPSTRRRQPSTWQWGARGANLACARSIATAAKSVPFRLCDRFARLHEGAVAILAQRRRQLVVGVHDDGAGPRHRLAQRPPGDEQESLRNTARRRSHRATPNEDPEVAAPQRWRLFIPETPSSFKTYASVVRARSTQCSTAVPAGTLRSRSVGEATTSLTGLCTPSTSPAMTLTRAPLSGSTLAIAAAGSSRQRGSVILCAAGRLTQSCSRRARPS